MATETKNILHRKVLFEKTNDKSYMIVGKNGFGDIVEMMFKGFGMCRVCGNEMLDKCPCGCPYVHKRTGINLDLLERAVNG